MPTKKTAKADKAGEQPVVSTLAAPTSQDPLTETEKVERFEARRKALSADTSLADALGVVVK